MMNLFGPGLLAIALGAVAVVTPLDDLQIPTPPSAMDVLPAAVEPVQPVQPISYPDQRLPQDPSDEMSLASLQPPCRDYADEPSAQPELGFAECWNEKKTAWERAKPSAIGPSLPQMNSPLSSTPLSGGAARVTPVP